MNSVVMIISAHVIAFCQGLGFNLCVSALLFASQNLLRLRWTLAPSATRYSRFALVAYFSRTVLNRVFDKDYSCQFYLYVPKNDFSPAWTVHSFFITIYCLQHKCFTSFSYWLQLYTKYNMKLKTSHLGEFFSMGHNILLYLEFKLHY